MDHSLWIAEAGRSARVEGQQTGCVAWLAQGKRAARCCGSANRRGRRLTGQESLDVNVCFGPDCNIEPFLCRGSTPGEA